MDKPYQHYVYSTLKGRGNGRFHVVSAWNTRSVFEGNQLFMKYKKGFYKCNNIGFVGCKKNRRNNQ